MSDEDDTSDTASNKHNDESGGENDNINDDR